MEGLAQEALGLKSQREGKAAGVVLGVDLQDGLELGERFVEPARRVRGVAVAKMLFQKPAVRWAGHPGLSYHLADASAQMISIARPEDFSYNGPMPDQVDQAVVAAARKHLPFAHFKVFLFGSRAAGTACERSDFDIGLDAGAEIPIALMARIAAEFEDIPVLQKIELVDFAAVPEDFRRQALSSVRVLYEQ